MSEYYDDGYHDGYAEGTRVGRLDFMSGLSFYLLPPLIEINGYDFGFNRGYEDGYHDAYYEDSYESY